MLADSILNYRSGDAWSRAVSALNAWVSAQKPAQLFRVNPLVLATRLGVEDGDLIDAFLASVLEGWFDLRWDVHCPACQGVNHREQHLKAVKAGETCGGCGGEYTSALDGNIEVTFTAAPKLVTFAPGEQDALLMDFHMPIKTGTFVAAPRLLTGLDLFHRPLFQERFTEEVLDADQSVHIKHVVLLFTDIKGSTRLYEDLGDTRAYGLVRDHFAVLFQAVESHGGVVVKTIGDAVMASFRREADALAAALDVHGRIDALKIPGTDQAVVVKMGLHAGPAIAVNLNDRFDYFGQTVNKAARIQGLAKDQEIYFSEAVFQDVPARRALASRKSAVRRWRTTLKGIEGEQVVYSVK